MKSTKECQRLRRTILNMEFEELEIQVRRGYVRKYELTEWAKRTPEVPIFNDILPKINVFEYTNSKNFIKRKKRKKLKKYRYVKLGDPKLLDLKINQYNLLSEKAKLYFHPIEKFNNRARMWITYYRFSDPQVFEYKIAPYFLTKIKKNEIGKQRNALRNLNIFYLLKRISQKQKIHVTCIDGIWTTIGI